MGMLQIIDEDSAGVLFDFDDPTGAANPHGLKTRIDDLDIGEPGFDEDTFNGAHPGVRVVSRIPRQATMSWLMRVDPYVSVDEGIAGVRDLGRLLAAGGVMRYQPPGVTEEKFIDYLPAPLEPLLRGQPRGLRKILLLLQDPDGASVQVRRQPYLRGEELDSATNRLKNPTLLLDQAAPTNTPDDWTWDNTGGITSQSIDAEKNAYRFDIATTSVRMLQQTTAAASYTAGDVAVFYFYGWVSGGADVRVRCRIEYLTAADGVLATHDAGGLTTLGAGPPDFSDLDQAVSLTAPAAPATTDKIRVSFRFENAAATQRTVWLTLAQAEKTALSLWVAGEQSVRVTEPTVSGGLVLPFYVHGDAPAPVKVRGKAGTSMPSRLLVGRQSQPYRGAVYLNTRKVFQAEAAGLQTDATLVADALASPGAGNSAVNISFATATMQQRLNNMVLTSPEGLAGRWITVVRLRSTVAGTVFDLRLDFYWSGPGLDSGKLVRVTPSATEYVYAALPLDQGSIQIPEPPHGITGFVNPSMFFYASRVSGTGHLRLDYFAFLPAELLADLTPFYTGPMTAGEYWETNPDTDETQIVDQFGYLGNAPFEQRGPTPAGYCPPGPANLVFLGGEGSVLASAALVSTRYAPRYDQ